MRGVAIALVMLPLVVAVPEKLIRRQWDRDIASDPYWDLDSTSTPTTTAAAEEPSPPVFSQYPWPPDPLSQYFSPSPSPTCTPLTPDYPSTWWYASASLGTSPFLPPPFNTTYPVARNALSFGADPTGGVPSTSALQAAIDHGGPFAPPALRNTSFRGPDFDSTLFPAVVYLPPGTYLVDAPLQLWTGTVLAGDAFDYNSNIILNDLSFNGGAVGMDLSGQQFAVKSVIFNGCAAGAIVDCFDCVFVDISCMNIGGACLDGSQTSGSLTVLDSWVTNSGTLVSSYESTDGYNQLVLENIRSDGGVTIELSGKTYTPGNVYPEQQQGVMVYTPRSPILLNQDRYFVMKPPTYREYSASQVLNLKSVPGFPVFGDGVTDDTESINAILTQYAGCKIVYIPAGTYVVRNTVFIPAGTRIYGDAYASVISAMGPTFADPKTPIPMVQVGAPGDVGVAQMVDMMFTVGEVLPGCKLVEVNMAGAQPGDVALVNSHVRVGGAAGSTVQTSCGGPPALCRAAWGLVHLAAWSSAYVENMWGWTADHDLDDVYTQNVATGRGMLVEATQGTWLVGTSMEHNTLYQYNFNGAENVFAAMQQSETPYWQGVNSGTVAPYPWTDDLQPSDPDFAHCGVDSSGYCGAALFEKIAGSKDLFLYGGCLWTFFTGNESEKCSYDCQQEAIDIDDASNGVYFHRV
ncbi:putative exo-beta- - protein [Neofusicoccum parvum UCRNP2]|uniref:Putative exo-beta--protein n=1 Tax=Botryosphaeria parva (strain UCR-NP2) TaxID=1287680 RepID=R1EHT2_BOTPV|nr:putative exo-beta- - protein [Neofusicoccum parvum UCRNP2]